MKIKGNNTEIEVLSVVSTTINKDGKKYPALRFNFEGGVSENDIAALTSGELTINKTKHSGYNTLSEVSVTVGAITTAEEERDAIQADHNALKENVNLILPKLDDNTALLVKNLYPLFEDVVGMSVQEGFRFVYGDKLYKTIQPEVTITKQYMPGTGTESLYTEICETHTGTVDDPIPYNGNMALENGKYYSQDGVVYLCNRDTGNAVYNALNELVGLYVETV